MEESRINQNAEKMNSTPCWMPRTGMKFSYVDEAWKFWVSYGGKIGFDARKQYNNKSADGPM
uniref:Uncharacterized protein n=1 Tax=Oryza meridionalis TaxID=40149 RepID=A0A0E0EAW0_9ORYZ